MLEIFPQSSLDNSILTSVLVGLVFVWFFQERFGWGLSGLVVPGYLASIFVIQPISGLVIVLEAVATYLLVVALSETVPRWWPYTTLFGRDRFFNILLVSVGVRLVLEGGGIDEIARLFGERPNEDLHSMGLVVVPLAANSLWRTGLPHGLVRVGVPVLLTWFVLQYVLLSYTNLSLSSFELTYEDLARDFVSSPRAYMILLVTSWMASVANLRWGWDVGGIIVPGLLALCWLEPSRLLATVGEVVVLSIVFSLLLRLPALRSANLTGGRPMVLIFAAGYLVKFALSWVSGSLWPGFRVGDLFGFGYLLPAIMALRVVKHGEPFQSLVPALVTSLFGFLSSSVAGYALHVALPEATEKPAPAPPGQREAELAFFEAAWRHGTADDLTLATSNRGIVDLPDGACWFRGDPAQPLAVSAELDPLALPDTALLVADLLDAKVVHLCGGESCARDREILARRYAVLVVEDGEALALLHVGRLPETIRLGRLEPAFGRVALATAETGPVLHVPEAERLHAAAARWGADPLPLEAPPAAPDATASPAPETVAVQHATIVRPWFRAWESGSEDALRLAAGRAREAGFEVYAARNTFPTTLVLRGPGILLAGRLAGQPLAVFVPDLREPPLVGAALTFSSGLDARLAIVDAPDDVLDTTREQTVRLAHDAVLEALQVMGTRAQVMTLQSLRPDQVTGADIVVSRGSPAPAGTLPLEQQLTELGYTVEVYDGHAARIGLSDRDNILREAARAASDGKADAYTTYLSPTVLRDFVSIEVGGPLDVAVRSLDRRHVALDALEIVGSPDESERALCDQATTALAKGREQLVRGWAKASEALGYKPAVACDPLVGCRWLIAERCGESDCEGLVVPVSHARLASSGEPDRLDLGLGSSPLRVRWQRGAL